MESRKRKREEVAKSTDASPSSSHPARQRELLFRGITEEEFVQGSKRGRGLESPGYNRETGKSRPRRLLERLSQYAYDYFFHKDIRTTTIEEHLHELRHIGTSIFEVSKELHQTVEMITNYEKQPLSTLKEELERYKEIKERLKNLDKVVETHQISDGDFQKFFESKKELIENKKQSLVRLVKDEKSLKDKLDEFEAEVKPCYELFDKAKRSLGLNTLEIFKNGKLKKVLENMYSSIKEKIKTIRIENEFMIKWVDRGKEFILLKIRQSNEYSSFKDICSKLEQISMLMEELDKGESKASENSQEILHQKDQLLGNLAPTYREFYELDQGLREKLQDDQTKAQWVLKGQKICEYAEAKSVERRERGMTRPVIEQSWKSFYHYCVYKQKPGVWMSEGFDKLMEDGKLKGEAGDYYIVVMEPKLPGNREPLEEFKRHFLVYVNPKEGVLVNHQEDRETERQWRETNFPEKFPQEWRKNIKKTLKINEIPREFFEPLYISDLSVLAYQLAVEKYIKEQSQSRDKYNESYSFDLLERAPGARNLLSKNDLSPAPLTEVVVAHIVNAETAAILHDYIESENPVIFERGKKAFDLVSATPFGRRIPFMQSDYRDIIGDGIIDRYEIYRVSGNLYIKGVIKPKDKSGA